MMQGGREPLSFKDVSKKARGDLTSGQFFEEARLNTAQKGTFWGLDTSLLIEQGTFDFQWNY